ncbi:GntR family transcriptional regulator [Mesorhizobium sp. WSM2239]|uniref:GntR family transcriptional regulator n=2 Tax=unclassified Mesorhizobium TaxID=325217 RepID=A0AAU8DHZ5_9HYPH
MTIGLAESQAIQRRSLHDELTELLRGLIAAGELAPGEKIPEQRLCERFGVSRTPLREALKVLANEGVVTLRPNRGAIVSALTLEELDEVFPIMGALEALSGEIACRHITDEEVTAIRSLHETMVGHWRAGELQPYFRLNQQIHEAILEGTRNETLKALYRSLAGRVMTARYIANMSAVRWAAAVAEHEAILQCLSNRDGKKLADILKRHLAHKLETVKDWLRSQDTERS